MEQPPTPGNMLMQRIARTGNFGIFTGIWLLTFLIYIPTARAGWVIDAIGFIYNLKHQDLWDYLNLTQSKTESFYQLVALHYLVFYKLWGLNPLMWSLLYITLHALNALLIFTITRQLLTDSGAKNSFFIPLAGVILFTVTPYISEVMVWRACYHYLQGFLFILLSIRLVQLYFRRQRKWYPLLSVVIFVLASFALEIFYLIPLFALSVCIYYRFALRADHKVYRKSLLFFPVTQVLLLTIYFLALYSRYRFFAPHVNNVFSQSAVDYLSKPPKYLFHILLLGRYFPQHVKDAVYTFCESGLFLLLFYSAVATVFVIIFTRFRRLQPGMQAASLMLVWTAMPLAFLMPLPFPGSALFVFYDRYTYFADGFIFVTLALLLSNVIPRNISIVAFALYAFINLFFTIRVNTWWKHSAYITNRLIHDMPPAGGKTVILLNIPENMNGVPMIGARPDGQFSHMRQLLLDSGNKDKIYDGVSYNMTTDHDGAHVRVVNDSMVQVTLSQWGTWWWYDGHGASSYENDDYRIDMKDAGHWYMLYLKHPASGYQLLYNVGDHWKVTDMTQKNEDQY